MSKALPVIGQMFDRVPQSLTAMRERAADKAIPMHAQVYLENRCHLKCQHCFEDEASHPTDDRLSLIELERALTDLAALGCLQLTLTGGEIFLRRDIFDILALTKKLRFQVTLFTSGTLLDREKVKRLKELKIGQVDVSVYSDIAADHDAFTQIPRSWQKSTDALRMLTEEGVKATLKCTLTTFNVDRIDGIIALAKSLGVVFQFDPNVRPRMSNDRSTLRFAVPPDVLRDKVYSRRDLYPGFRTVAPDRICRGNDFMHGDSAMCGAGRATLAISANGDVLPCGFFPDPVGNMRQTPLRDIWERSALMQDLREMTYAKMSACPSCDVRSGCHPCMAYAQVEHGDYKQCNTASRMSAEALVSLSERGARTNAKFARAGRALPIVGELELPKVDGSPEAALAMFD